MKRIQRDVGEYSVIITLDSEGNFVPLKSSCTCIFGSFYKWTKKNLKRGIECWHLKKIRDGIQIKDHHCLPAQIKIIEEPLIWKRVPPIRDRKSIPTCWLELSICEGKNRQVRRMTAAMGFPTLRLIRVKIGPWHINELKPGQYSQST